MRNRIGQIIFFGISANGTNISGISTLIALWCSNTGYGIAMSYLSCFLTYVTSSITSVIICMGDFSYRLADVASGVAIIGIDMRNGSGEIVFIVVTANSTHIYCITLLIAFGGNRLFSFIIVDSIRASVFSKNGHSH